MSQISVDFPHPECGPITEMIRRGVFLRSLFRHEASTALELIIPSM